MAVAYVDLLNQAQINYLLTMTLRLRRVTFHPDDTATYIVLQNKVHTLIAIRHCHVVEQTRPCCVSSAV